MSPTPALYNSAKLCNRLGNFPVSRVKYKDDEERDRFWNDMDKTLNIVGNGYRLCVLGDINGWIEDRARAGITGDNGRRVVEFYTERGMCVGNTYLSTEVCISTQ